jgi:hypothetical protein
LQFTFFFFVLQGETRRRRRRLPSPSSSLFSFFLTVALQSYHHLHLLVLLRCNLILKKMTTTAGTFFDGFIIRKWGLVPFFYGFATKKVTGA